MDSVIARLALWMATLAVFLFDLVGSGVVQDRIYYASLSQQEYADVTGNGVVPGFWLVMPFITVVVIFPLWLVMSGVTLMVATQLRPPGSRIGGVAAVVFFCSLVAVSVAVHVVLITSGFAR